MMSPSYGLSRSHDVSLIRPVSLPQVLLGIRNPRTALSPPPSPPIGLVFGGNWEGEKDEMGSDEVDEEEEEEVSKEAQEGDLTPKGRHEYPSDDLAGGSKRKRGVSQVKEEQEAQQGVEGPTPRPRRSHRGGTGRTRAGGDKGGSTAEPTIPDNIPGGGEIGGDIVARGLALGADVAGSHLGPAVAEAEAEAQLLEGVEAQVPQSSGSTDGHLLMVPELASAADPESLLLYDLDTSFPLGGGGGPEALSILGPSKPRVSLDFSPGPGPLAAALSLEQQQRGLKEATAAPLKLSALGVGGLLTAPAGVAGVAQGCSLRALPGGPLHQDALPCLDLSVPHAPRVQPPTWKPRTSASPHEEFMSFQIHDQAQHMQQSQQLQQLLLSSVNLLQQSTPSAPASALMSQVEAEPQQLSAATTQQLLSAPVLLSAQQGLRPGGAQLLPQAMGCGWRPSNTSAASVGAPNRRIPTLDSVLTRDPMEALLDQVCESAWGPGRGQR